MRIPLLIFPLKGAKLRTHRLLGITSRLAKAFPWLKDLQSTKLKLSAGEYLAACVPSAALWGIFPFLLTFVLLVATGNPILESLLKTAPIVLFGPMIFLYYALYPKIFAGKIKERVDQELVFVLKDMLVQISSGVPLLDSMQIIARSDYGIVSSEFEETARQIGVGIPIEDALQNMALRTESEFMRKAIWQLVNGYKAGASLKNVLRNLVESMVVAQTNEIRSYAQELNMWILVYMMLAVAAPTIGATLMVVLSAVAGVGITPALFVTMILTVLVVQIVLIGFVKSRRPVVSV